MRYDLIDLQGQFKIQGNTGSDNLGLGYSGSNVEWIESQLPGPTYSFLKNSGYNYYIVGATGTPTENAQGLLDVNNRINTLWTSTPAVDNRYSILLMPGEYDFINGALYPVEFTDYIGLSSDPYHTVFRNTAGGYVVREANGFDFGLENVYLLGDGPCYATDLSYPRWKNVAFGGITFDITYSWIHIRGEYTNIIIENGANAFFAQTSIDGKFSNISAKSVDTLFSSTSNISGTFSNIFIGEVTTSTYDSFSCQDNLSGSFEKIEINNSITTIFSSRGITGKFKNMKFKNVATIFAPGASGIINAYFENIQVDGAVNVFYSPYSVSGILKNINLKNITSSVLYCNGFIGQIKDLTVSQSPTSTVLNCSNSIEGVFENINVDSLSIFNSLIILGTFSNINTLNSNCFLGDTITATITDSKFLGTFDSLLLTNTYLGIDVQNLIIGTVVYCLKTESLYGNIQNLTFESCNDFLYNTIMTSCTASKIYGGNVGNSCFYTSGGNIEGYFKNINIGNVGNNFFVTSNLLNCDVYDVKAGNITGNAFFGDQILGKKFRNITLGDCSVHVFTSGSFESPNNFFENISVGNVGGDFFVSTSKFDGTYQKIKAGSITGHFFKSTFVGGIGSINMSGWYKDIDVISCDEAFQVYGSSNNKLDNIRIENLKIGSCNKIMCCGVGTSSVIRNLWVVGDWTPVPFGGSLENSFIDKRSFPSSGIPDLTVNSVIKRSKILSILEKPVYYDITNPQNIYLSEFNYIANDNSGFYNYYHNIADPDVE